MGGVNRYTKISTADYNPMSMQELMINPSYLRKKHDDAEASIIDYQTKLAQIDALDVHNDIALQKQNELNSELDSQIEDLSTNGFTRSSKSNMLKFNSKYNQEMSPTGTLGKIINAKTQYKIEKKQAIDAALKAGQSMDDALRNWDIHSKKYNESFNGEDITNIESLGSPKNYDYISKAMDLFSKAGITIGGGTSGSGNIIFDKKKGTYVVNTKTTTVDSSNKDQLEAASKFMNDIVSNPNSDAAKSIAYQGKTTESVLDELKGLSGVYAKDNKSKNTVRSISNFSPIKHDTSKKRKGLYPDGSIGDLTATESKHKHLKFSDNSFSELKEKALNDKLNVNERRLIKGYNERLVNKIESNEKANIEYKQILEQIELEKTNLKNMDDPNYDWKSLPGYNAIMNANKGTYTNTPLNGAFDTGVSKLDIQKEYKMLYKNKIRSLHTKIDDLAKPFQDDMQIETTSFMITPTDSKGGVAEKYINSSVGKVLSMSPSSLRRNTIISGLQTPDGESPIYEEKDLAGISMLVHAAGKDAIEVLDYTKEGFNGMPSYKIRINTTKDNIYNLEWFGKHQGDIGGGKPVVLTLSFKDNISSDGSGIKNVSGLVQNYVAERGGEQGRKLVQAQNTTNYRNAYAGTHTTFGDLKEKSKSEGLNYREKLVYQQGIAEELGVPLSSIPVNQRRDKLAKAIKKIENKVIR